MEAGIYDQADGAQHLVLQTSVIAVWVLIEADLFAEPFGIKRPTFLIGGVSTLLTKWRQRRQFLRDGNLHVVAGDALVISRRFIRDQQTLLPLAGLHHDVSRARTIRRSLVVVRRSRLLCEFFNRHHF